VREALLAAQAAYAELLLETRERTRDHAELVSPRSVGWREVARQLGEGEALIEYLVGDSASLAFLVLPDSLAVVDLGIGRAELARLVAFARGTVESPRPATDSLWRGPFRRLYRHLIAPIEDTGLLAGTRRLVFVPHVELHYLPFAALLGDSEPLVMRYDLATTPSASLWLALGDRPERRRPAGVLAMAPRPDALPGSEREVRAVGRLAGDGVDVLTGSDATEAAFRRAAPGKRVLHLSTYGVLNQHNPLFSFVEFAPDGGEDGRLEVHEVFGLALDADVVVLSACQTGLASGRLADVPAGDDWVGLTRAFLHAGAGSVVATLWAVEDRGTATLMEEFYAADAIRVGPGRALAGAQLDMLRRPAIAHPFYWAGVVVVEGRHP
jgi:CHAT domain-containing protein